MKKSKFFCWGIFFLLFVITYFNIDNIDRKYYKDENIDNNKVDDIVEELEENYQISMVMVGDNLIHSSIYKDAYMGNNQYDFTSMYELVKPIVSSYDIAYYNQETILGGKELGLSDYPLFNSPYEVGDAMVDAGFNLVSLASNHTIDKGEKGIINSRNYWNSKSDVLAVGSYSSFEDRDLVRIIEKNNITYTMLNYTYGTNGIKIPDGKEYLVNVWPVSNGDVVSDLSYQEYKEQVRRDIDRVRDSVDVLMVAMHWGVEYTHTPTNYQEDMALYLASLGVDIVIGTHPHVIQPIEWIDDTLVIYSLGNFISAQYQDDYYNKMVGLMSSVVINKNIKNGVSEVTISNLENDFVYTYYKNWRDFKVVPFSSFEIGNYLGDYVNVHKYYEGIVKKYDDNIFVKAPYGVSR